MEAASGRESFFVAEQRLLQIISEICVRSKSLPLCAQGFLKGNHPLPPTPYLLVTYSAVTVV